MIRYILFALTFLLTFKGQAQTITPEVEAEIGRRVTEKINPSLAIGILHPDGSKTYYNYGSYDHQGIKVPDSATIYEIGSITKTFTALATNRYITDQNAATLDLYFPEATQKNPVLAQITLDQLKNHNSGMPRLSKDFAPNNWSDPFKGYSEDFLEKELSRVVPDTSGAWRYSNFGFAILGKALEKKTEKAFDQLMSEIALQVGMPHTYTAHHPGIDSLMARPTNLGSTNSFWHFEGPSRYAGGLLSSTADLLRYLEYQIENDPLFDRRPVEGYYRTGINTLGKDMLNYKDGWFVYEPDEYTQILFHNGGTGGFTSFLAYNKRTGMGIAVLSNSVSLADDIALKIIYPPFTLKSPERTIGYELARKIDTGAREKLVEDYDLLKRSGIPNNLIDIYWLERYHFGEGHYDISDQLSTIMLLELPEDPEVLDIKGQNLEKQGNYIDAKNMYEMALELDPQSADLKEKIDRCKALIKR